MNMPYKLRDICHIRSGKRIPLGMSFSEEETPHPYIRARDIKNGTISTDDLIYLDENVHKAIEKYIIQKGDIAITIVGASVGDVAFADDSVDGYNLTENAVRLTGFKGNVNGKYVFYQLIQKQYRDYMQTIAGGAAQPKLGIYKVERIKVALPEKRVQDIIVRIISAYDKLIEVNNKRIKVLEQMAENLYKEWFVRFRFPGHETAEFENGIPRGWNITRCKDIVPVLTGKKDANYGDDGGPYPFFTCAQEPIQAPDYSFDCAAVLLAGNCDLNAKVYKGKFEAYQRTYVLSPHNITHLFLLYYVIKDNVERLKQASTGAAISFITKGMIERIHFLLPPNELLVRFHGIMDDLYTQKDVLMKLNKNLIKQRDLLLPRLMSGKLEV